MGDWRRWAMGLGLWASSCSGAQKVEAPPSELRAEPLVVTDQTLTGFTVEARFQITNSNETPLHISGSSYALTVDGQPGPAGTVELDQTATPGQVLSLSVPVSAELVKTPEDLQALVARGENNPLPLAMVGALRLEQDGKTSELKFTRVGQLRAPRLPVAKMNDADLGRTDEDVTVSFYLGVQNQNPFEIRVKSLTYHAEIDGKLVGEGVASTGDRLPASQSGEYPIRESVTNLDRSKTAVPYHFTGTIDVGLAQVPVDLTGTLVFSNKKPSETSPTKRPAKSRR